LIPQRGWGKNVPNWLKNQMWNLMPIKKPAIYFIGYMDKEKVDLIL